MTGKQDEPTLKVSARAPFHIYYEGPAQVVTATNKVGKFDILPGHADFFSVLNPGTVEIGIDVNTDPVVFNITHGIVTVRDNEVLMFVNM